MTQLRTLPKLPRIIKRLEAQKAEELAGCEIAELLEFRLQHTNCAEFMTPPLIFNLIQMLAGELTERAVNLDVERDAK